jgi:hypothetical protein
MEIKKRKSSYPTDDGMYNLLCKYGADPATVAELLGDNSSVDEAVVTNSESRSESSTEESCQYVPFEFGDIFEHGVGRALSRYYGLFDWLGDHQVFIDVQAEIINFGDGRVFPIQLLGTESHITNTWLWAWANTTSNLPAGIIQAAEAMRNHEFGEGVHEIITPKFPIEQVNGFHISLLGSSWFYGTIPYYYQYDGGSLHMLIEEMDPAIGYGCDAKRIAEIFSYILEIPGISHLFAIDSFMRNEGFQYEETDSMTIYTRTDNIVAEVTYDKEARQVYYQVSQT